MKHALKVGAANFWIFRGGGGGGDIFSVRLDHFALGFFLLTSAICFELLQYE